jgi:hypothetical protein
MTDTRRSLLVPGIWLVGLGTVFLVQQLSGWPWVEAWPLFVIMGGVCGALSALVGRRWSRRGIWGVWGPLATVVIGVLLLATTTGVLGLTPDQLARWWPLAIIGIGIWFLVGAVIARGSQPETETLAIPLAGADQAEVRIGFGGGELNIGPAPAGLLVSGTFEGGVLQRDRGPGRIELQPYDPGSVFWAVQTLTWDVGITAEIPVDLRLDTGANRSSIDLSALRVRRLELHTGASESHVRLPASGASSVRAEAGVAALTLQVPEGVSARINSKVALGTTKVNEARFPRSFDGWASADWETAANRVEIQLQGGLGTIRVE